MSVDNHRIAEILGRYADLLAIEGANPFRIRAYRNAVRMLETDARSMADLVGQGANLEDFPGIGKILAGKIETIVRTGALPQLAEVEKRVPSALADLLKFPGLGPKHVKLLYDRLGVRSEADLKRVIQSGELAKLPGFGPKTATRVEAALAGTGAAMHRFRLDEVERIAEPLIAYLRGVDGIKSVTVAGSYRRRRSDVGDLDVLVTARRGAPVMARFTAYPAVAEKLWEGDTRTSVRLDNGIQVDLRLVPEVSHGAALYYFTGSKAHSIAVRRIALAHDLKINEYGVYRGEERIAGRTEEDVFKAVALPWIDPELREDRGEVRAALEGRLPKLVARDDLQGDLRAEVNPANAEKELASIAKAAKALRYAWVAVAPRSAEAGAAAASRTLFDAVDRYNARSPAVRFLKLAAPGIRAAGTLDLAKGVLGAADIVTAVLRGALDLPAAKQATRIRKALDDPHVHALACPFAQLAAADAAFAEQFAAIFEAASARGIAIEMVGGARASGPDDVHVRAARDAGCRVALASAADAPDDLSGIRFALDQARRGWIEAQDVLNALPADPLLKALRH